MKKIIVLLIILLFFGLGIYLTKQYYTWNETKVREQSEVLLEKVKSVYKLVTVEGHFSEVYDYEDYWGYNFSPFRKKALIRVKAKVLVGYDLEKMEIEAFPDERRIVVSQLPEPQIISIEHDLDYYDITEGTFNTFGKDDYNKLNNNAKQFIVDKAQHSDLVNNARQRGNRAMDMMQFIVENAGWQLEVKRDIVNRATIDRVLK